MESAETLRHWHCRCGYNNVGYDPCAGCNRRAPRRVRSNTKEWLEARQSGDGSGDGSDLAASTQK